MLLVIDIGNTNIVFGVYDDDKLVNHWRLSTALTKTVDEYAILLNSLLYIEKIRLNEIHRAIVSCVVPPLLIPFEIV
ncbi:MAG: type III pantothenate kinase [Syntrophorhabdus sp.]